MTAPLTVALDSETFYAKDYSIRELGNWGYTHDPRFRCYMLSVATDAGDTWCGSPEDFDWPCIEGATQIYANAGFDLAVIGRLVELQKIPKIADPPAIFDVLDLARYLGFPGNLAGAASAMLGVTLDKKVRDSAKGKHWEDFTPDQQTAMKRYAIGDVASPLKIWQKYNHLWPEWERELARLTREMCERGLPVDIDGIDQDIKTLEILLKKVRNRIPWKDKIGDDGKGLLSKKEAAVECKKLGIAMPSSMAKDSEEFDEWLRVHGESVPWARAMGSYRSVNGQLKKLRAMRVRTIEDRGVMVFGLKYAGAHTLRDSGDGGCNVQNFAKEPMFEPEIREMRGVSTSVEADGKYTFEPDNVYGIDMRGKICAPEGFTLGVIDLVAIEPCALAVLAEDKDMVELLMNGMDPYEAWARVHHGYADSRPLKEVNTKLRQLCKVEVLGLGYGAGPDKLVGIAKTLAGLTISLSEAQSIVFGFRKIPYIPTLWSKLETAMRSRAGKDFTMGLHSGREMLYREVKNFGSLSAITPRNGKMMRLKYWGGTLCLTGDTEILTHTGWKRLISVTSDDLCWDGISWVRHEGLLNQGVKPTIRFNGVGATPDHKFLSAEGWVSAEYACGLDQSMLEITRHEAQRKKHTRQPIWKFIRNCAGGLQRKESSLESSVRLRGDHNQTGERLNSKERLEFLRLRLPPTSETNIQTTNNTRAITRPDVFRMAFNERPVPPSISPSVEKLWRPRDKSLRLVGKIRELLQRHGSFLPAWVRFRAAGQQLRLFARKLLLGYARAKQPEQTPRLEKQAFTPRKLSRSGARVGNTTINTILSIEPRRALETDHINPCLVLEQVYDLKNCGPRHRFLVRANSTGPAMIAHNCENATQATARDIMMDRVLAVAAAGYDIRNRIHDEIVCLFPEATANNDLQDAIKLMSTAPEWGQEFPVRADGHLCRRYHK